MTTTTTETTFAAVSNIDGNRRVYTVLTVGSIWVSVAVETVRKDGKDTGDTLGKLLRCHVPVSIIRAIVENNTNTTEGT